MESLKDIRMSLDEFTEEHPNAHVKDYNLIKWDWWYFGSFRGKRMQWEFEWPIIECRCQEYVDLWGQDLEWWEMPSLDHSFYDVSESDADSV